MDVLYNPKSSFVNEDGYVDMLKELQKHKLPTFQFATKNFKPPKYIHCHKRHPTDIWKAALKSDRVQWIVRQTARDESKPEKDILVEVEKILKKLAFTDHMSLVRMLGVCLYKVQSAIYQSGVFINIDAVEKIRSLLEFHPVILMPSHRSYMDFLMLSLVCFYFDLPLPAIAAGMDFQSMTIVSGFLRASGAFFMRRSFGSDRLYWAIFTEYVHTIIINGDRPMEFFIEGTRSRTGKSLNPKFGLLSVISEPYLKAQTYDAVIVPVSISYDRLLEEKLYAYELLGVPKPKESTSGLVKATSILKENYGSVHVHFGEAMSLRQHFKCLDRSVHAVYPRYMLNLSEMEQMHMKQLAYKIVLEQLNNMICSPWTVIAAVLCVHPNGIFLSELLEEVMWLKGILKTFKVKISWPADRTEETVQQCLYQYRHLVAQSQTSDTGRWWINVLLNKTGITGASVTISQGESFVLNPRIQEEAVNYIMVANYRNQLLNYLVRPALIAFFLQPQPSTSSSVIISKDNIMTDYLFLVKLLHKEFIFEPGHGKDDLNVGFNWLIKSGVITSTNEDEHVLKTHMDRMLTFFRKLFSPFLLAYWLTCQYFLIFEGLHNLETVHIQIQGWFAHQMHAGFVTHEMLSLNVISNAVQALVKMDALLLHKTGGSKVVEPLVAILSSISVRLGKLIKVPSIMENTSLPFPSSTSKSSKL